MCVSVVLCVSSFCCCSRAGYEQYARHIRLEYGHVPLDIYKQKRGEFLLQFAEQETLFSSELYASELTEQVRRLWSGERVLYCIGTFTDTLLPVCVEVAV